MSITRSEAIDRASLLGQDKRHSQVSKSEKEILLGIVYNDLYSEFFARNPTFYLAETEIVFGVGISSVKFPSDAYQSIVTIDMLRLSEAPFDVTVSGTPVYYKAQGSSIVIHPTPSSDKTYTLRYHRRPVALQTPSTVLDIPAGYSNAVVYGLSAAIWEQKGETGNRNRFKAQSERVVQAYSLYRGSDQVPKMQRIADDGSDVGRLTYGGPAIYPVFTMEPT